MWMAKRTTIDDQFAILKAELSVLDECVLYTYIGIWKWHFDHQGQA